MRMLLKVIFVVIAILILDTLILNEKVEAIALPSYASFILIAHWWEIPFQPPEKWFTPRWEDDQWYQQRHQKQYKKQDSSGG